MSQYAKRTAMGLYRTPTSSLPMDTKDPDYNKVPEDQKLNILVSQSNETPRHFKDEPVKSRFTRVNSNLISLSPSIPERQKTVVLFGDINARLLRSLLINNLRSSFLLTTTIKPYATIDHFINNTLCIEIMKQLNPVVVIVAGAQDIMRNEAVKFSNVIAASVNLFGDCKVPVILTGIPYRYDFDITAPINMEIKKINRLLDNFQFIYENYDYVSLEEFSRFHFNISGSCLNMRGTSLLAQKLARAINVYY